MINKLKNNVVYVCFLIFIDGYLLDGEWINDPRNEKKSSYLILIILKGMCYYSNFSDKKTSLGSLRS